jgi:hypothetical protein
MTSPTPTRLSSYLLLVLGILGLLASLSYSFWVEFDIGRAASASVERVTMATLPFRGLLHGAVGSRWHWRAA